ncbi:MAG TPA: hypothetical protein PKK37_01895, partial [Candidatus Pacearchaeota archaeon]|nr:hypothetical protein [Candidatus Pacearchaeota archaeon]
MEEINQKGFAAIVVALVIAVALLAGVGIWVWQTQIAKPVPKPAPVVQETGAPADEPVANVDEVGTETAEITSGQIESIDTTAWKTYRNEEYGFELKYPKKWSVANNILSFPPDLVFCPNDLVDINDSVINCRIKNDNLKPSYEQGIIYLFSHDKSRYYNNANYQYLGFGGLTPRHYYLFFDVGGNEAQAKQMISTFKFIDIISRDKGVASYSMEKSEKGFSFPKITVFEDENIKNKINARLKEVAAGFCECSTGVCQVGAEVTYSSNYIFSVNVSAIWSCEGYLHDARVFEGLVFDMKTGNQVAIGDVFDLSLDMGSLR